MFIRKRPEHLWMAWAGFWLLATKLAAAEGRKRGFAAGGCGGDWPQQVPAHDMSLLLSSPSVSK